MYIPEDLDMRLPIAVYEKLERIMQKALRKVHRIRAAMMRGRVTQLPSVRVVDVPAPGAEQAAIQELAAIMVRIDDEA